MGITVNCRLCRGKLEARELDRVGSGKVACRGRLGWLDVKDAYVFPYMATKSDHSKRFSSG